MNDTAGKADPAAHESQAEPLTTRKPFVEPEVSGPVDVLEATIFFQSLPGPNDPPRPP